MKKFDRLPPQQRKEEIQTAALELFQQKGFSAVTMENIVEKVTLSKGGVYRLYSSTAAILSDLMIRGMQLRNAYYGERVRQEIAAGKALTLPFLVEMIGDSLLLYPEFSSVYVEFLWEKQRNPELEALYQSVCTAAQEETTALIRKYGAENLLLADPGLLRRMTELMNAAILSLHILNLQEFFSEHKEQFCAVVVQMLSFA